MSYDPSPSRRSLSRLTAYALGTVFLGAIGSGLWERVFSPLFGSVSRSLLGALVSVSRTYRESLYRGIGEGASDIYAELPFNAVLIGLVLLPFVLYELTHVLEALRW